MKRSLTLVLLALAALAGGLLQSGCDNMSVGVGFSGYDPGSGMSYGFGVSSGPYGNSHGSFGMSFGGHP
jgi:hypothetical protein